MILNAKQLATTPLRKDALRILNAGYDAINIAHVVGRKFRRTGKIFCIEDITKKCIYIDLNEFRRVFLIGIGKGSALAADELAHILGNRLRKGIAIDVVPVKPRNPKLRAFVGTHPFPSKQNVRATKKIIDLVKTFTKNDIAIFFVCGGGSSLAIGSDKELKNAGLATHALMAAGADIIELNTVRKHLSAIKGGGLAKICYPARVISLVASDVLGNDITMAASGILAKDTTSKNGARKILEKYLKPSSLRSTLIHNLRETSKDGKFFANVTTILFASNNDAATAMKDEAARLGFHPRIESLTLHGEAKTSLIPLIKKIRRGEAIIAAGETTVTLMKHKTWNMEYGVKGGRNQEAVLGALYTLHASHFMLRDVIVASIASDAHDNTEAAGAIGDRHVIQKARKLNLPIKHFLKTHDSFPFFQKTGDLLFAEHKNFNVADLMLVLRSNR